MKLRYKLIIVYFLALAAGFIANGCKADEGYFKQQEFACPCCGKYKVDPELINKLEQLRAMLGDDPITITSGYRCPKHNKEVGGAKHSQHMKGKAADIKVKGYTPSEVAYFAKIVGFSYVKIYKTWVHVDVR